MGEKEQYIKVFKDYSSRLKDAMHEMRKVYSIVEHISQSFEIIIDELKEELKKEV